jgi:glutamate dehydrogenase (NADP+)
MLKARGLFFDGRRVVVSGSGNVAIYAIEKVAQLGGQVVACSDSSGYLVDERGIDVELLKQVKEVRRARLDAYLEERPEASFVPGGKVWEVPCEIALPCASQNEIAEQDAIFLVKHGCLAVGEGANMPTTPEAVQVLTDAGVAFGPGKAANAGGVAISALEMQQNAARDSWSVAASERRLEEIMRGIHDQCVTTGDAYGMPGDYVAGANIAGFTRVADAMLALGVV